MLLLEGFVATESVDPEIDAGVQAGLAFASDLGMTGREAAAEPGDHVLHAHFAPPLP